MRSLASAAREARHAALLDEAAIEFNRAGVAGASLAQIAKRVGISRAGVYNYCADREDLVEQSYMRACLLIDAGLVRASRSASRGLDKVTSFLNQVLDIDHPPMAVLSEIAFLPAERRERVVAARARNVAGLGRLIAEGVEDGSVRPCDIDLACQSIFGVLSWAPLSRGWTDNPDEVFAIRMAAAIPALIADGVAAPEARSSWPAEMRVVDVAALTAAGSEVEPRMEQLARAGSRLFNERGIDGVSLDDVAAAVGATKGLLYHYFDSKPDFVAYCYERAFDIYDRLMGAAEISATGAQAARLSLELNVQAQIEDIHPLSLSTGFACLSGERQRAFVARTGRLTQRAVAIGQRGVKDGSLRPFDLEPVSLASAGTFSYLSKWLPPGDNRPGATVARQISDLFLLGLRKPTA
jgi:AcrR family transcriptional regulator